MDEQSEHVSSSIFNTQGGKTEPLTIETPAITLPTGGGAVQGIDETFAVNAVNGTASFSVPLPISPARGATPTLTLSYSSGNGNSIFGLGWSADLGSIRRKTNQELPRYLDASDSDTFLFAGADDLVPEFEKEQDGAFSQDSDGEYIIREQDSSDGEYVIRFYKPRIEGVFARIERWTHRTTGETRWRVTTRENMTTLLGWSAAARIADPQDARKVYEWLPEFIFDDRGNCCRYRYKSEDDAGLDSSLPHNANRNKNGVLTYTNRYLEKVLYGNKIPYKNFGDPFPAESAYMFQTVFDYGEYDTNAPYNKAHDWLYRPDAFSDYRPGFEVRTTRLCQRVLLFHVFEELPGGSALIKSLNLQYNTGTEQGFTFLRAITSYGYIKQADGTYTHKHLPPMEFDYQKHAWNKTVETIAAEDIVHAPAGLDGPVYQFTDLYSEGLPGILTEQANGWYYKRNLGGGTFEQAKPVSPKPSFTGLGQKVYLSDLDSDGGKQLVSMAKQPKGYFELNTGHTGPAFTYFEQVPNRNPQDPNSRMIDLTGDGRPDLLITENEVFTWYESEGRRGYGEARKTPKPFDEEAGPAIVFADSKQTIFLADMDGDGLVDIVRIRASEVCYWPNMGYGKFGAKIALDNPPVFDAPDAFNPAYIQLADIDGSGTTDIIYANETGCTCWLNLNGNRFATEPFQIAPLPEVHNKAKIILTDLLGTGTMCLVWSSPLSKDAPAPLRYIDLMGSKKPHIMIGYRNNFGKEVRIVYTPSTSFYLDAERAGHPWVTKLHFPVHCISSTETVDRITGYRFVSSFSYRHGYYDRPEREFRGFGMVEQTDAEHVDHWVKNGSGNVVEEDFHQEPVVRRSWFHTGAFLDKDTLLNQFAEDYWYAELARQGFGVVHSERQLPEARLITAPTLGPAFLEHLSGEEWQQALRACKGMSLRSETFAHDAPTAGATPQDIQTQLTPYAVASNNCIIELLQPKGRNKHAVFIIKNSETVNYEYERDISDPRTTHSLNIKFDEYGTILESAKVAYPRKVADATLPADTQAAQARTCITYAGHHFTNDIITANTYRLRLPSEVMTFELKGVAKAGDYYAPEDFEDILGQASDVPYHQKDNNPLSGSPEKRLIEHVRTTYYKDDLTGPLPLHQLESPALQFESYQLAFTPELLADIFGAKATDAHLLEGKFTHSEGDVNWWVRSGTMQYKISAEPATAAADRFFMPISYTDPFGAVTKVNYLEDFFTFVASTEDVLGNIVSVDIFNFRTLAPQRMRDINDNLSEALADELGMITVTALLGKGNEADNLTGQAEHTTAAVAADIAAFFAAATSSELTARGKALLGDATTRIVYDLEAYQTSGKPAVAASVVRAEHFADNDDSPVQISFEYSGGLGQLIMKKGQAEPGHAKQVAIAADGTVTINTIDTTPELRWVGTGRTVVNNKGNPVKQYEPYFSVTHRYEDNKELVESGVTPLFYYDALGREVKMVLPDGTFSKTEFTSWQQTLYDQGDTVQDSNWYTDRINSMIDAGLTAEGKDPFKEKLAAIASGSYHNTPSVKHLDTLNRPILQVQHNRLNEADEFSRSKAILDIEGNLLQVIDARNNNVMTYKYDMLGLGIYQHSMDSGQRWLLTNVVGSQLRTWDERGHEFRYEYDTLGRPVQSRVIGGDGPIPLDNIYDRIFYGESIPDAKANNLRGQVVRFYDTGGLVETTAYDFKGKPLNNQRRLFAHYRTIANWTDANMAADLEPEVFASSTVYDALGRAVQTTAPDGSIERTTYNPAGLIETKIVEQGEIQEVIIANIDYNEKGQRTKLVLGNGVITTYHYDKYTFNLIRVASRAAADELLQDVHFTSDATGNVIYVQDDAVPVQFFNNQMVTGLTVYKYDALYRLVEATGRENDAALAFGPQDNWNDQSYSHQVNSGDPAAVRNYIQRFAYDTVGNILQQEHFASNNNWTREYTYEAQSNRLVATQIGAQAYNYEHHPQHGFITRMPHLDVLGWNFKEKLVRTIRQNVASGTPETTYYQYSADGQRLRKITENASLDGETPTKKEERIYLGNYELYKKHSGQHAGLERHSLSVVDASGRIALIEARNEIDDGTEPRLVRYQLCNHLGSVNLEVDQNATIISYEEYHPFGTASYRVTNKAVRAAGKRYRYTGMERDDETGLAYHSARYYIPWLGRWLSPDPIGIGDGLNVYRYAKNNPGSVADTNGNESDEQKASRMFEEFLTEQGVNYKKEVPFRVEVDGKWVNGRADFFVERSPGTWEPVEMKGKADSKWTRAQEKYLPALQSGAKFETRGNSKFKTPVSGSGGGKVFNVHTVAQGQLEFKKLFTAEYWRRPSGDPGKGEKVTITKDKEGAVVSKKVEPDTKVGTRTSDVDLPKGSKGVKPKAGVRGKGLWGALIVAGGTLLITGDAEAAVGSLNPAPDTTEAVTEGEGIGGVVTGVALDIASIFPPVALLRTGIALNEAAMEASHFPTPEGWVEQKVAEGRNPFCALCHGPGGALDEGARRQKELQNTFDSFDQLGPLRSMEDLATDEEELLKFIETLKQQ